jgi:hypothetical protein
MLARALVPAWLALAALVSSGCSEGDDPPPQNRVVLHPGAPPLPGESTCEVVITTAIPVASAQHVQACTPVGYATNPPSGGDHWPMWAAFKSYAVPVPREMYVHNLEHGGVVLAYRCTDPCPEVIGALQAAIDGAGDDPKCAPLPAGPRVRLLLTPDDALDTPVAAAAWGATYTATCLDSGSLSSFIASAYAKGPEDLCSQGIAIDDPAAGGPDCDMGRP